ncbi:MAG: DNA polymerase [bacterium]|nr:DNA polymerase [bacterium]
MKQKSDKEKKTIVLLDAHAILHRAYHALPGFSSRKGEPTGALYGLSTMLMKIIRELTPDYVIACYDRPEPTFRHEAYDAYKVGRPKTDDELVHQIKRSQDVFTAFGIPIYEKAGFEADDILGTIVEKLKNNNNVKIIIASGDMDTLQLVDDKRVVVYTLKKGINDTITYDEDEVMKRFGFEPKFLPDWKGLRGDPSDNIIGIKGIGEKTATILITNFHTIEDMYKKLKKNPTALKDVGIKDRIIKLLEEGEEEAIFSKTLATIRRDAPIEFSIPKEEWRASFEPKKLETLFTDLDFRSLRDRVKDILNPTEAKKESTQATSETTTKTGNMKLSLDQEPISEEDFKKAQIALWLINSDITNPKREDILQWSLPTAPATPVQAGGKDTIQESLGELLKELKTRGLEKLYHEIELPLIPIIKRAEERGVLVDIAYLKDLSKDYHKKLSVLEEKIWESAGEKFNINSPKQLGVVLFDNMKLSVKGLKKTAGGARSTRESELEKLQGVHPVIDHILAYRELQKLLSTYIDNIPEMAGKDGRLHANLNQTGTTTGRMSSSNPNLQNIPTSEGFGKAIRNAFIAAKGHKLIAGDYSQIEMRVLAELSEDKHLRKFFQEGKDVHAGVAAFVFGVKENEVTKDMRRKAKVINFGIIYGMGVNALRGNLGGTREEAQEFYNNYFKKFPSIAAYFENTKNAARKKGYTETFFGRRRYFESIKSSLPFIRASAERMAQNAPIQGTAADLIRIAMKKVDDALEKEGLLKKAHIILQVHDELIYEVEEDTIPAVAKIIKHGMESVAKLSIPLEVNISVGDSWGGLKEQNV